MDTDEAIASLQNRLAEISDVLKAGRHSTAHTKWVQNVSFELGRIFGPRSGPFVGFMQLTYTRSSQVIAGVMPWDIEDALEQGHAEEFGRHMGVAQGILESAIEQMETHGLDQLRKDTKYMVAADARRVFITHGHDEDTLRRIEDFVRALGMEPVVVKRGASEGMAVDDLVEVRMKDCIAQIVLATADDKQDDGTFHPRLNVIHEVGLGQRMFGDKVIYLKEEGCSFPSNVGPKVWETFKRDDIAPAFEKIVKELRAFGFV